MLRRSCEPDFAEKTAATVLRALGVAGKTADTLAGKQLALPDFPEGLLAATLPLPEEGRGKAASSKSRGRRAAS